MSYGRLWEESGRVVALLRDQGIHPGDRVMVAYLPGLDFLPALFGCMRFGAIACSVYPPNPANAKHSFAQFNNQVADAGAKFALTSTLFRRVIIASALKGNKTPGVKWLATDKLKHGITEAEAKSFPVIKASDIAFIQYTSGSTSVPKGVVISHGALFENLTLGATQCYPTDAGDRQMNFVVRTDRLRFLLFSGVDTLELLVAFIFALSFNY